MTEFETLEDLKNWFYENQSDIKKWENLICGAWVGETGLKPSQSRLCYTTELKNLDKGMIFKVWVEKNPSQNISWKRKKPLNFYKGGTS